MEGRWYKPVLLFNRGMGSMLDNQIMVETTVKSVMSLESTSLAKVQPNQNILETAAKNTIFRDDSFMSAIEASRDSVMENIQGWLIFTCVYRV